MSTVYLLSTKRIDTAHMEQYGLDQDRLMRIAEMKREEDKKRSIASSLLLKNYLLQHRKTLNDVKTAPDGKPYVEGLHFSLSHSGTYAALAVSEEEIGVDIEEIRPYPKKVMKRRFSIGEQAEVIQSIDPDEMFMRIWTAKEAYLKMTGSGIRTSLVEIDTSVDGCVIDHGQSVPVCMHVKRVEEMVLAVCTRHEQKLKIIVMDDDLRENISSRCAILMLELFFEETML